MAGDRALLRAASEFGPAGVVMETFDGLGALPFFDADAEAAGLPARVADLQRAISEADPTSRASPSPPRGRSPRARPGALPDARCQPVTAVALRRPIGERIANDPVIASQGAHRCRA